MCEKQWNFNKNAEFRAEIEKTQIFETKLQNLINFAILIKKRRCIIRHVSDFFKNKYFHEIIFLIILNVFSGFRFRIDFPHFLELFVFCKSA